MLDTILFPKIDPFAIHYLEVSDGHTLYIEESGNPLGKPVVYVHGGPGGETTPQGRRFFDPGFYRIIQFDQRGCGKSTPHASLEKNTTQHLIGDMESIREYLQIEKWLVFGGSWGSTLSLCYAISHSTRVVGLILRGIFLARQEDCDWLYQNGASNFFPDQFADFRDYIPVEEQGHLLKAYYQRLTHPDVEIRLQAARHFANWEHGIITLFPPEPRELTHETDLADLAISRMESHYFVHNSFLESDNYILEHAQDLKDIPMYIVHGRYDVDCRPINAWLLHQAVPHSILTFSQGAGHSPYEETTAKVLVEYVEQAKKIF